MAIPDVSILRRCVGALCFVLVCGALAFARPTVQGPTTNPEFADPRTSMTTYQRAITAWKNQRDEAQRSVAKACFDVRHMASKEADYAAGRVAEDLDFVLDRVVPFDPTKYADRAVVGDSTTWTIDLVNDRHPTDVFTLEFTRLPDGRWVFGRSVVERVSDWWSVVQDWPLVAGAGKKMTLSERVRATVPVRFQEIHFWLEDWQWLGLLGLMLAGWALKILVSLVFRHGVDRLGRAEGIRVDRDLLASFERPLALFITALLVARGLVLLDVEPAAYGILFFAASLVLDVAAVWAAFRLVDVASSFLAERAAQTENKFDDVLVPLLRRTLKIVVAVVGILYLATLITDDVTSLVAGISIGTLALGFAAKDSIENLFGTFTVLLDKPFQLGDFVSVDGTIGTVEDVGFRSTRLRTPDDSLVTVPNSKFISALVDNLGARRHRRVRAFASITYDTPTEKIEAFCEGARVLMRANPNAKPGAQEVWLFQMSASSLDVLVQTYVVAGDFTSEARERHKLFTQLLRLAESLGVSFAFPTQTIHLAKPEDLLHPDAPRTLTEAQERGRAAATGISKTEP